MPTPAQTAAALRAFADALETADNAAKPGVDAESRRAASARIDAAWDAAQDALVDAWEAGFCSERAACSGVAIRKPASLRAIARKAEAAARKAA